MIFNSVSFGKGKSSIKQSKKYFKTEKGNSQNYSDKIFGVCGFCLFS